VREFRAEVERRTFYALIAPARARNPGFTFRVPKSFEGPLWTLVTQRPAHLVPPGQADWRAFLLASADAMLAALATDCPRLAECTWGRANTTHIQHPLSKAVPRLGALLDMQSEPLPGDEDMPRVQGVAVGASERFAVSPGREAEGYFDMPGGQSGHPLSPFYRAGHAAWAHVEPAPFLPGPAAHVLTLSP
jgi:penicillin amidase